MPLHLTKKNVSFPSYPYFTQPLPAGLLETLPFEYFDKDGYEVPTHIERVYYSTEGIVLNSKVQFHTAPVHEWYVDENKREHGFVLDHAMLLFRYGFTGAAKQQLEEAVKKRPILRKLLDIKPKYGIDFSLDYVDDSYVMEVIHIEQDFHTLEEANAAKQKLERIIERTDWDKAVLDLRTLKHKWIGMSSDDQSDYKARFFGWHRAFDNRKVI